MAASSLATSALPGQIRARAANRPKMKFINGSGLYCNTIHATDFTFYEEVNKVIQEKPADSADPEILGQLAAIGIVKGKPFPPDARMKKILTDAVAIGNATARALSFKSRDEMMFFYPGKGRFTILRLYGALEPWFDKTWRSGEIERVK